MEKLTNLIIFLLLPLACLSQNLNFQEYSYTEFFNLIEQETDSVFKMENAVITFNKETDSSFIGVINNTNSKKTAGVGKNPRVVKKAIHLSNVHFAPYNQSSFDTMQGVLNNIRFEKEVRLIRTAYAIFTNCTFNKRLTIRTGRKIETAFTELDLRNPRIIIKNSELKESGNIWLALMEIDPINRNIRFSLENNIIHLKSATKDEHKAEFYLFGRNFYFLEIYNNTFKGKGLVHFRAVEIDDNFIVSNTIEKAYSLLFIHRPSVWNNIKIVDNSFNNLVLYDIDNYQPKYSIPFKQFNEHLTSMNVAYDYLQEVENNLNGESTWTNDTIFNSLRTAIIKNELWYKTEISTKGMLYDFYKSKHDTEDANKVYMQIKDLETDRLNYIYNSNPSFKTFFKWKVNQFLKLISDYGTEPSKAITFSVYVIILFAFIYLFFPNSWDKHGKNRIIDRYKFFFRYMNKHAGIHLVYLEGQKDNLLTYEEFKTIVAESGKTVPKFFSATAIPLYKWAVSGTNFSAALLKRFDIMEGTWNEVPKTKRLWKSFLLIGAFLIALLYDLIIKVLNAVMLSINTFTTLGFGEIPIKGLPRYLAIIQGFIGWFMLTIFSVSLISQLLN